jgi:hypothetical protein
MWILKMSISSFLHILHGSSFFRAYLHTYFYTCTSLSVWPSYPKRKDHNLNLSDAHAIVPLIIRRENCMLKLIKDVRLMPWWGGGCMEDGLKCKINFSYSISLLSDILPAQCYIYNNTSHTSTSDH